MPHTARAILAGIWGAGAGKPSLPSSCLSILSTVPTTDPGGHHAPLSQPRKGKLSWSRHAVFGLQSHLAPLPHRTWFCSSHCESCAIKRRQRGFAEPAAVGLGSFLSSGATSLARPALLAMPGLDAPLGGRRSLPATCCSFIKAPGSPLPL